MKSKGFTLIELLVVVAIISLLSSVVLASLKEARKNAEETAIRTHLQQTVNALELYRTDRGDYPLTYGNGRLVWHMSSATQTGELAEYISPPKKYSPSIVEPYNPPVYYKNDPVSEWAWAKFGCGQPYSTTSDPYVIFFQSPHDDLKLPRLYRWNNLHWGNYYCVNMNVR